MHLMKVYMPLANCFARKKYLLKKRPENIMSSRKCIRNQKIFDTPSASPSATLEIVHNEYENILFAGSYLSCRTGDALDSTPFPTTEQHARQTKNLAMVQACFLSND